MTTQPEALRLADEIQRRFPKSGKEAADELRRLHESHQELLAALKALVKADAPDFIKSSIWQQAFVAINKAEKTTP
tara:strand:- start:78 stop:305 length:228 start_codon:yes stop_codon:yes gene_type:complete